jgi:hypothetical protein
MARTGKLGMSINRIGWGAWCLRQSMSHATGKTPGIKLEQRQRAFVSGPEISESKSLHHSGSHTNRSSSQDIGNSGETRMEERGQPGFLQRLLSVTDIEFP